MKSVVAFRKGSVTVRKSYVVVRQCQVRIRNGHLDVFAESEKDIKVSPLVRNPQLIVRKGKVAFRKGPVTVR